MSSIIKLFSRSPKKAKKITHPYELHYTNQTLYDLIFSHDSTMFRNIIEQYKGHYDFTMNGPGGDTLLHTAAMHGAVPFVEILIENGANVHLKCRRGIDALNQASLNCAIYCKYTNETDDDVIVVEIHNYYLTIKYLLEHGADCTTTGPDGHTALIHICRQYHRELVKCIMKDIVELLLMHGSKHGSMARLNHMAEETAREKGNIEIADFIHGYQSMPDTKGAIMEGV